MTRTPPGPRGLPLVGSAFGFSRDPLGFSEGLAARYGDAVGFEIAGLPWIQLNEPGLIHEVLVTRSRDFRKGSAGRDRGLLFGRGLASNEGEAWRRQRRLIQPAFRRDRVSHYAHVMSDLAHAHVRAWPSETELDLHPRFMRISLDVVARVLFGADVEERAREVGERLEVLMNYFGDFSNFAYRFLPKRFATPAQRRFRQAVRDLDAIVYELIASHRARGKDEGDLLATLIAARDEDDSDMSDAQLRDEVMTFFLAGHETTAIALSWSLALLAHHADIEAQVATEVLELAGDRPVAPQDLPRLVHTRNVLHEAMRLYPPAWVIARQAMRDVDVGDFRIPSGTYVAMSQWVMHRHPEHWEKPTAFLPARWGEDLAARLEKFVYFPFGAGQRVCIGNEFALAEATLVLATVVQHWRFEPCEGAPPAPDPSLSLRPRGGVRVRLSPRPLRPPRLAARRSHA